MSFTVGGSIHVTAHRTEEVKEVFQADKPIQILVVSSEFRNCDVLKDITLVQIRIWNCEEEKAEHLIA